MERFKLEFVLHWIWAAVFGLMVLTGIALLGPKYGWILNYNLGLADYLHRTLAVTFTFLTLMEIILELRRILWHESKKVPWLVVGKKTFALINFIAAMLFIITGILSWLCVEDNHALVALALTIHEMVAYAMVIGMVWHLYDKSHVLIVGGRK
jgi:cytochrome b subunit of formate dehydrogenase